MTNKLLNKFEFKQDIHLPTIPNMYQQTTDLQQTDGVQATDGSGQWFRQARSSCEMKCEPGTVYRWRLFVEKSQDGAVLVCVFVFSFHVYLTIGCQKEGYQGGAA